MPMCRRFLSLLLCAALCLGLLAPAASAAAAQTEPLTVTLHSTFMNKDYPPLEVTYSDAYFSHSAYEYDHALAQFCLAVGQAAGQTEFASPEVTCAEDDPLAMRRRADMAAAYAALGFENAQYYHYGTTVYDISDKTAFSIASRPCADGTTLVAVFPRSVGYYGEWYSNLHLGDDPAAPAGFALPALEMYDELMLYLEQIDGPVRLLLTGYSRGAAIVNRLAAQLDEAAAENEKLDPAAIYTYTFASPQTALPEADPHAPLYGNIFNIVDPRDIIPCVLPSTWGYARYGVDRPFTETPTEETLQLYRQNFEALRYDDPLPDAPYASQIASAHALIAAAYQLLPSREVFLQVSPVLTDVLLYMQLYVRGGGTPEDPAESMTPEDYCSLLPLLYGDRGAQALAAAQKLLDTTDGRAVRRLLDASGMGDTALMVLAICVLHEVRPAQLLPVLRQLTSPEMPALLLALLRDPPGNPLLPHYPVNYLSWMALPEELVF